jgi:hypothetical protein
MLGSATGSTDACKHIGAIAVDAATEVSAIRNPNLQQSAAARCRENAVPGELRTHRLGLTCDRRMLSMSASCSESPTAAAQRLQLADSATAGSIGSNMPLVCV